ncbi:MAG: response regulator transcription factor [Gemmatimonadota bacterium]|jgi:DNA-binding response OmpR family regulator
MDTQAPASSEDRDGARPRVLVVEDDRVIQTLLRHLLERRGYLVDVAGDGRQALRIIETGAPPALVLLDIVLPYVHGFDLIQRIRETPGWTGVPVIMLTSKAQEKHVVRALDAGANDYVLKPFKPEELAARVRRFIRV